MHQQSQQKIIQQVSGQFLFLGRPVNPLLCPISAIASQSSKPNQDTMNHTLQLLDFLAFQGNAVLTYNASNMILAVHSDASYLSEPKAHSQAKSHFYLSKNATFPPINGAILSIAHIIIHVMTSTSEPGSPLDHSPQISIHWDHSGGTRPQTTTDSQPNQQLHGQCIVNGKILPK